MTDRVMQISLVLIAVSAGVVFVTLPYDSAGGVIIFGAVVALMSIIVVPRLALKEDRRYLTRILVLALIAKLAATGFRLYMNDIVYRGGDLNRFDRNGANIAAQIRSGDITAAFDGFAVGSPATDLIVGIIYAVTGTTFFGLFVFSAFLGFMGSVFFYRAFRTAFPSGSYKLFTALIFFYPAVLYWPTGLGKDVIVFLMLGLTVYGAPQIIVRSRVIGLWIAILGIVVMFIVRPEIGLMAGIAFVTAFVLRKPSRNKRAFAIQVIGVPIVLMIGFIFISRAASFLGIESLSFASVLDVITEQSAHGIDEGRTGSNFSPPTVGTATWIPAAFTTVLFRPFPWEVHNVPALIQAFDGVLLAAIMFLTSGRLFRSISTEGQNPILIFSIVFLLLTVIALGTLGNFGLLARQRVIVLPVLFFVISAARSRPGRRRSPAMVDEPVTGSPFRPLATGSAG